MRREEKKGSVITSVIAALIFVLILTIFGRSVQGAKYQRTTNISSSITATESSVVGSGFYQIHILDEAKYRFMPPLRNME